MILDKRTVVAYASDVPQRTGYGGIMLAGRAG